MVYYTPNAVLYTKWCTTQQLVYYILKYGPLHIKFKITHILKVDDDFNGFRFFC